MTSPTPEPSQSTEAAVRCKARVGAGRVCGLLPGARNHQPPPGGPEPPGPPDPPNAYHEFMPVVAARPEPPVEGALEEARREVLRAARAVYMGDPRYRKTMHEPALEAALATLIAAARSGHDGLTCDYSCAAKIEGYDVDGQWCAEHASGALSPDPGPVEPGGAA